MPKEFEEKMLEQTWRIIQQRMERVEADCMAAFLLQDPEYVNHLVLIRDYRNGADIPEVVASMLEEPVQETTVGDRIIAWAYATPKGN